MNTPNRINRRLVLTRALMALHHAPAPKPGRPVRIHRHHDLRARIYAKLRA